jgi:hypothetical protein
MQLFNRLNPHFVIFHNNFPHSPAPGAENRC